ncbi:Hypothetical_protein [Hexamita inflata]|uniref:Hypothetical_protein n=1 Tax=Hexamita inflata TaxID=28002 RepID=A0AA86U3V6_9EUKA|nr:Hypothetical protein HINF_LOCUS29010 [Hexamita inflata]
MLVEQPQVPKSYSRSVTMQSHKLWELKVYLNYFWIQIKEISIELDQITVIVLKYPILMYIIITQQKEIIGEDNKQIQLLMKYAIYCNNTRLQKLIYFSYNQKMFKHCLKLVRCYINTKQRCHLYLSVSSCFPYLKASSSHAKFAIIKKQRQRDITKIILEATQAASILITQATARFKVAGRSSIFFVRLTHEFGWN